MAHVKLDVKDGQILPWLRLYDPQREAPIAVLCTAIDCNAKDWEPYDGPDSDSEEYKAAQRAFADNS